MHSTVALKLLGHLAQYYVGLHLIRTYTVLLAKVKVLVTFYHKTSEMYDRREAILYPIGGHREKMNFEKEWKCFCFLFVCLFVFTPPRNRGGVIFLLQFVCLSVNVCVCLWTKFQPNECTNFDAVFLKLLLNALAWK